MIIKEIKAEKILSLTNISIADYVINPYRGCSFGCLYCYGKKNKSALKKKIEWGKFTDVKINAPALLKKEIIALNPKKVLIGSTTDPYQPLEKKYCITKGILEVLAAHNIKSVILTRSSLITRDIPLLQKTNSTVYFTLNAFLKGVSGIIEEKSDFLEKRVEAVKELNQNNIKTVIYISPYIPFFSFLKDEILSLPNAINIEIYNPLMGSLGILKEKLAEKFPAETQKFLNVYNSKREFKNFCGELKRKIKKQNRKNITVFIPEFNDFYQFAEFDYNNSGK